MVNNIVKCNNCNSTLIQEELENHICYNPTKKRFFFDTDNDFVEVFDGLNWIPIKSEQPKGNTNKNNLEGNSTILKVLFR